MCFNNSKLDDGNAPESRLEWSEILFQVYQLEAAQQLQSLRDLRTIWRFYIVNADTRTILGEARTHGSPEDGLAYTEYRPRGITNDSGFFALLGYPNGSGVVRMLTEHCSALGRKTIESIRVPTSRELSEPPTIYFVLVDAPITTPVRKPKRSAAGQRRDAKRKRQKRDGLGGSGTSRSLGSV